MMENKKIALFTLGSLIATGISIYAAIQFAAPATIATAFFGTTAIAGAVALYKKRNIRENIRIGPNNRRTPPPIYQEEERQIQNPQQQAWGDAPPTYHGGQNTNDPPPQYQEQEPPRTRRILPDPPTRTIPTQNQEEVRRELRDLLTTRPIRHPPSPEETAIIIETDSESEPDEIYLLTEEHLPGQVLSEPSSPQSSSQFYRF